MQAEQQQENRRIRCGDTVLHLPSGEEWIVAYADYEHGFISWSGWPEGMAAISDCELVRACTDEEHAQHVALWVAAGQNWDRGGDHRPGIVARLYARA